MSFGILLREIIRHKSKIKIAILNIEIVLLKTVAVFFIVKLLSQTLGAIPHFSELISVNIDFVISYLHWVFLGVISISLFAFLHHFKLLSIYKRPFVLYLIGFFLTEALLVYKGIVVWKGLLLFPHYFTFLFIASTVLLVAIVWILMSYFKDSRDTKNTN